MSELGIVAFPGCAWTEISPALAVLRAPSVRVLGPGTAPVATAEGVRLLPDVGWAGAEPPAVLLVPGGDPASVVEDPELHAFLADAVERSVVGAICNGALLLARAGCLRGRSVTHTAVPRYAPVPAFAELLAFAGPVLEGSRYVDEDVVVDGRLVTAKPWAALDFAKAVARAAGRDREEAASRVRYQRGLRDGSGRDPYVRWVALLAEIPGVPTTRDHVQRHVEHLRALERAGVLELAGPFPGRGAGMVVIRAADEVAARAVAEADPFVAEGVRTLDLRRWLLSCDDDDHLLGPPQPPR